MKFREIRHSVFSVSPRRGFATSKGTAVLTGLRFTLDGWTGHSTYQSWIEEEVSTRTNQQRNVVLVFVAWRKGYACWEGDSRFIRNHSKGQESTHGCRIKLLVNARCRIEAICSHFNSAGLDVAGAALSSLSPSTIAAPCVGRAVASVIAIRAYPGGKDPERKRPCQFQRGFKAAASSLRYVPGVRRRELPTESFYMRNRRTLCALPLAVFLHPGCFPCWITIRHKFTSMRAPMHRVPSTV